MSLSAMFIVVAMIDWAGAQQAPSSFVGPGQELHFQDEYPVFNLLEYDEWIPYQGAGLAVHVYATPTGGVYTEMWAISDVKWPQAIIQTITGQPGTGWLSIDTELELGLDLEYDVFGLFADTIPLWSDHIAFEGDVEFDPLLLGQGKAEAAELTMSDANLIPTVEFGYDIIPGLLGLEAGFDFYPQISAGMSGNRMETISADRTYLIGANGEHVTIDPETMEAPGLLDLLTIYYADMTAHFDLVIEPYIELTYLVVFETEIFDLPIPIGLVSNEELRAFPAEHYQHAFSSALPIIGAVDFGNVDEDLVVTAPVSIQNIGYANLEGWVGVTGSEAFTVFPETMVATPGNSDGVTVTFSPSGDGEYHGSLVIDTNDPITPRIEIPLMGRVGMPIPEVGDGSVESFSYRNCGCAAEGGLTGWLSISLAAWVTCRRRRQT